MERNDDNLGNLGSSTNAGESGRSGSTGSTGSTGGYGNTGDLTGSAGYGAGAGAGAGGSYGAGAGSAGTGGAADAGISYGAGSSGAGAEQGGEGMRDRARDLASNAGERLSDVGSTIRERAGSAKNSLADMLEAGAQRLSGQGGSQQVAGATSAGTLAADGSSNRFAAVAGGLHSSAEWLRETDLDGLRTGVENQVRNNPGRSLLIAVGLGYLLGKALRK